MSNSRYIATIMNRHFITTDSYFFTFRNTVLGTYNEKSKIFTDIYGNEYYYMMSSNALNMDVPYAAYHVMKIDELQKQNTSKNKEFNEMISEYANKIEKKAYFVGYTKDFVPFLEVINLDKIREDANKQYNNETTVDENPILKRLEGLILDTVDGKFSKEQLIVMKDNLEDIKDTIENVIGTMDTKIGAIESNKTFKDYLDEQLENPICIVKPTTTSDKQKLLPPPPSSVKDYVVQKAKEKPKTEETTIVIKPKQIDSNRIDINKVYNNVTKTLIAQDDPARRVIVEIVRKEMDPSKKKEAILITGPTGVGKTELMRLLSEHLNKPLLIVDSTEITTPGYTGKDITELLWDLYVKCGKNKEKAEHAIIYFDEIDKKGSEKNSDVNGKGVLNTLLQFIEGTTYDAALNSKSSSQVVKIDTSNMTIIAGGAFSDMYKHLLKKNEIGFNTDKTSLDTPQYRKAEIKDFVEYGLMTYEFMGRVTPIKLNDLGKNDLRRVLLESDRSALKKQEALFKMLGVKLTYTSDYIDRVIDKAYSLQTGVRGIISTVDESTWKAYDDAYTNEGAYSGLILTAETVDDSSNYQMIKRKKQKK